MSNILPKYGTQVLRQFLPLFCSTFLCSCAYRFSNTSMLPPGGIRTIAVEAVYDTSREVIPHEYLWSAVQRELAGTGRLLLTSQSEADALVTLWLTKARINPTGTPTLEAIAKDPVITNEDKGNPQEFRNLRRAGRWTTAELVTFTIEVEIIDLKSRNVLFKRSYSQAASFNSLRSESITPAASSFLHYDEALHAKIKTLSKQFAQIMVADFFASRAPN